MLLVLLIALKSVAAWSYLEGWYFEWKELVFRENVFVDTRNDPPTLSTRAADRAEPPKYYLGDMTEENG